MYLTKTGRRLPFSRALLLCIVAIHLALIFLTSKRQISTRRRGWTASRLASEYHSQETTVATVQFFVDDVGAEFPCENRVRGGGGQFARPYCPLYWNQPSQTCDNSHCHRFDAICILQLITTEMYAVKMQQLSDTRVLHERITRIVALICWLQLTAQHELRSFVLERHGNASDHHT